MDAPLAFAGLALGLAAAPHCALMCGAPCAAVSGGGRGDGIAFQLGRVIGYAAGGAVAAASVGALAGWVQASPVLKPLWTLLHLGLLALGLWWLLQGRPPQFLQRDAAVAPLRFVARRGSTRARAGIAGLAWVAWPCAALQSALLLAALASSAPGGALVMAAFALASMPALIAAPWAWARLQAAGRMNAGRVRAIGYRIAGAGLFIASGWALTHGVWGRFAAWCFS
jgi:sulfite exporter TauE/SafE